MRLLYLIPGPQERLHEDHSFHLLQPPFTKNFQGKYFVQSYVINFKMAKKEADQHIMQGLLRIIREHFKLHVSNMQNSYQAFNCFTPSIFYIRSE